MYFRKLLHITGIVCLLSIFVWSHTTHAYPDDDTDVSNDTPWKTANKNLNRTHQALEPMETRLVDVRDAVQTLSDDWEKNRKKVQSGNMATVSNAASTLISAVTTVLTGGTGVVAFAPTLFQGWLTAKGKIETGTVER